MKFILFALCFISCNLVFSSLSKEQFLNKYPNATIIEKNNTKVVIQYTLQKNSSALKAIPIKSMSTDLKNFLHIEINKPNDIAKGKHTQSTITENELMKHLGINNKKYNDFLESKKEQSEFASYRKIEPIAKKISAQINKALLSKNEISVIPTENEGNLMVIDDRISFDTDNTKKIWLIVVVGAVGKVLNKYPNIKINNIYMADSLYANKYKKALMIKAAECMKLQKEVSSYKIDMEQFYSLILKSTKEISF